MTQEEEEPQTPPETAGDFDNDNISYFVPLVVPVHHSYQDDNSLSSGGLVEESRLNTGHNISTIYNQPQGGIVSQFVVKQPLDPSQSVSNRKLKKRP